MIQKLVVMSPLFLIMMVFVTVLSIFSLGASRNAIVNSELIVKTSGTSINSLIYRAGELESQSYNLQKEQLEILRKIKLLESESHE